MGLPAGAREQLESLLATPHWRTRESVSPSYAARLLACGLKAAFDSEPRRGTGPESPAALLGTICHDILAEAARGRFGPAADESGWRAAFDEDWDGRIEKAAEGHPLSPERWPAVAKRKVAARRIALGVAREADAGAELLMEHPLGPPGTELRGRVDLIVRSPVHEIRDYKTGPITGEDGSPRHDYLRQLLLYSVLERQDSGGWPGHVVLVPFRGPEVRATLDPAVAEAEAEGAVEALRAYNAAIEQGRNPEELAVPSPEACRYCDHAPRCAPFWSAVAPDWAEHRLAAVAGLLAARRVAQNGGVSLEVTVIAGTFDPPQVIVTPVDVEEFWGADRIELGSVISITGLRPHSPGYATTTAATQMAWVTEQ